MRARFRSNDDAQHLSALTELYLHHFLIGNGYIPKTHPDLDGVDTRPDFLVFQNNKSCFFVEAVTIYNNKTSARVDKFEANICDAIDAVNSPDFLVSFNIKDRNPDIQPKTSGITRFLQNRIDSLDYTQAKLKYDKTGMLPKDLFSQKGWKIEFNFRPVTPEARKRRTNNSRVIGMMGRGVSLINVDLAIKESVIDKSKKYGEFNLPFLIAVNVIRDKAFCDDEIILDALFGKTQVDVVCYSNGSHKCNPYRSMNGIWAHPKDGLINNNISGILFLFGLTPATILEVKPVLWHHPKAIHPFYLDDLDIEHKYFTKESGRLMSHNKK